jgi:NADH:ubiquinone oxidoreductase subunit 5 (subunit L)/multisubunit Na+/H+ antiporter MnhA subunit
VAALDKNVAIYIVGAVTALLTAFYSFRAVFRHLPRRAARPAHL